MRDTSLVILNYIVPPHPALVDTSENSASALWTLWHQGYDKKFIWGPLLTWTTYVSNLFGIGRGLKISKIWLADGAGFSDAANAFW